MASFAHLGQLLAFHTTACGVTAEQAAATAGISPARWQTFQRTGYGVSPQRIGVVADLLGIDKDALLELTDPHTVLGLVWGPALGEFIREHRAFETRHELAARCGVSAASILRWELAGTRPRNREQLTKLLAALHIDPFDALRHALWPPRATLTERSTLGSALLARRDSFQLTSRQAAARLDVSQGAYNAWERGRSNPEPRRWARIAEFLDVDVNDVGRMLAPERVDTFGLDDTSRILVRQRRASGERRAVAAERAGLSPAQVRDFEAGRRHVQTATVPKFAAAFHLDPFEAALLLEGTSRQDATFGQLLRAARKSRGLHLRDAAAKLASNHNSLSLWEQDRCLPVTDATRNRLLRATARTYKLPVTELRAALARTMPATDPFAAWFSDRLDTLHLTQTEAARRLGLRPQVVANWSNGRYRPGKRFAPALGKVLGVPAKDIEARLDTPRVRAA